MKKKPSSGAAQENIITTDLSKEVPTDRSDTLLDLDRYSHKSDVKAPFLRFTNDTQAPAGSPVAIGTAVLQLSAAVTLAELPVVLIAWLKDAPIWVWAVLCPVIFLVVFLVGAFLMFRYTPQPQHPRAAGPQTGKSKPDSESS